LSSLTLAACCLLLEAHQKISGKILNKPWAMCHGPPGTMATGRCA